uniref:Malate dehydrogenase n=1 Tax=Heterosiphonia pulchra TaxID=189631 RepID=A0A097IUN8_9FLOR|nr:malate dehydrogenase [Heterosiphonia pulchra]
MTVITKSDKPLTITVTGAAGQISYSLLPLLATGKLFGRSQPVNLHLLEIPPAMSALNGVVMELQDLASPLLRNIVQTSDPTVAFRDADVIILVGAFPRRKGMARRDLLSKNVPIFTGHAQIMADVASSDVHILVVGNPANTNAMILSRAAPSIPSRNITALTRLDHNRSCSLVARKCHVTTSKVEGVVMWGNHSATQYPDFTRATAGGKPAIHAMGGEETVASEVIPFIQKRGASVIEARGASSAMSAAQAIIDHLQSWLIGDDRIVSMAVPSDGSYGVKEGVWFSFPVRCLGSGEYEIVTGLEISAFAKPYIDATADELFAEREEAIAISQ